MFGMGKKSFKFSFTKGINTKLHLPLFLGREYSRYKIWMDTSYPQAKYAYQCFFDQMHHVQDTSFLVVVSNIFYFHPLFGEDSHFD